ncbi:MAG TPA: Gfo/Idh/MocA family oxidoreductase [Arachnia sp.]|nr:Gfo/Idh/MocA family oxidoreductase [Arachnia sp.]HMT84773.1 Gfo/Idh/MocA family oxidoreductase [Arachnia sp.]
MDLLHRGDAEGQTAIRWAILGPGAISHDFATALHGAARGSLHAVGSSDPGRARRFADDHGAALAGDYEDILGCREVDAVYIGTVHVTHVDLTERALRAGKAVLCEKPMSMDRAGVEAMTGLAGRLGLPLVEAYKYRFSPHFQRVRAMVSDGDIGDVVQVEASFGFAAPTRTGRLFDPALGGGAILDVGCYPLSFAIGIATAQGVDPDASRLTQVRSALRRGVEVRADAVVELEGITARVSTSIVAPRTRRVRIQGTEGTIELPDGWGSRTHSPGLIRVRRGRTCRDVRVPVVGPMAAEADAVSAALVDRRVEAPEMPHRESVAIAGLVDRWRQQALATPPEGAR